MPSRYTARILDHLAHDRYEPSAAGAIATAMRVEADDQPAFNEAIAQLAREGRIVMGKDGLVRLPPYENQISGKFRLNAKGFGFVIPDRAYRDGDLFIPAGNTRDAVSGDRVRAEVIHRSSRWSQSGKGARNDRSPFVGRIVEVLERGQEHFVGTLVNDRGRWFVKPDGRSLHDHVLIRDPHAKNAKEGDKVAIELMHYPEGDFVAEGVIVKVLGEAGRPDVETQAVIIAHGLRTDFPGEVIEQARATSRRFDTQSKGPWPDREDLTDRFIFTIDPPDAKDFDDAISIRYDAKNDEWELGVHIADVTEFVPQASGLDKEAVERGNSVYLPRLVLPMLPEVLSNGVCSLQEGVPRFTKSAFIILGRKGKVISQRLANTVINSRKRLTYLEAQALIDGKPDEARQHARTDTPYTDELVETLRLSDRLAKIIQQRRRADGMIVLNLPEVTLTFDEQGHVNGVMPEDDAFTHKLIEMFMVEANEAVARIFADLQVPVLRRIHPEPSYGDIEELKMYARAAHQQLPDEPTRFDMQRLLEATHDTPASKAIHFAVLRTLTKATYSPALIGHYALASDHYAHFTSPIRRYPDLSLHRAVAAYVDETDNGRNPPTNAKSLRALGRRLRADDRVLDESELLTLGTHCSDTEREAEEAERELTSFLVLQFLQEHHMGEEFTGVVTGITGGGIFVSLEPYLAEGMVRMADMPSSGDRAERWAVNERSGRLTSARSGASIGVGDVIRVQIARINLAARQMDLLITQLPEGEGKLATKGEPRPERATKARPERKTKQRPRGSSGKAAKRSVKKRPKGRRR